MCESWEGKLIKLSLYIPKVLILVNLGHYLEGLFSANNEISVSYKLKQIQSYWNVFEAFVK